MARIYYDQDAPLEPLRDHTVAVIGYGSQGHAHALNLRDSGIDVVVGLYQGSGSWAKAEAEGLAVATVADAARRADVVAMLAPDHVQRGLYDREIAPHLRPGGTMLFAHGFNIHYNQIQPSPELDVVMVAPKSPGHRMRELFVEGSSVPALLAIYRDATGGAKATALAYARGIGCTKAGVIETTFREETETDLFGEQAVLCGGMTELIRRGFETLVNGGYQPEIAYFEVLHELKLIVDLVQAGGIEHMWDSVSNTAEYGGRTRGPFLVNDDVAARMDGLLRAIRSGEFAKEWVSEYRAGLPKLSHRRQQEAEHEIERVGARVRALFESGKAKRSEEDAAWMTASPAQPRS